jgi:DNA-binding NtrC family response regulator
MSSTSEQDMPARPPTGLSRSTTILFVDDDQDLREMFFELTRLKGLGDSLCLPSLGAVEAQRAEVLGCSLAILDINLGNSAPSGIDVYRWLQGAQFGGKVVFLTGYGADDPAVQEAASITEVPIVTKPITIDELAALVAKAREVT